MVKKMVTMRKSRVVTLSNCTVPLFTFIKVSCDDVNVVDYILYCCAWILLNVMFIIKHLTML